MHGVIRLKGSKMGHLPDLLCEPLLDGMDVDGEDCFELHRKIECGTLIHAN